MLRRVTGEIDRSPADVALAWDMAQLGIGSVLIGASRPDQLTATSLCLMSSSSPEPR